MCSVWEHYNFLRCLENFCTILVIRLWSYMCQLEILSSTNGRYQWTLWKVLVLWRYWMRANVMNLVAQSIDLYTQSNFTIVVPFYKIIWCFISTNLLPERVLSISKWVIVSNLGEENHLFEHPMFTLVLASSLYAFDALTLVPFFPT